MAVILVLATFLVFIVIDFVSTTFVVANGTRVVVTAAHQSLEPGEDEGQRNGEPQERGNEVGPSGQRQ